MDWLFCLFLANKSAERIGSTRFAGESIDFSRKQFGQTLSEPVQHDRDCLIGLRFRIAGFLRDEFHQFVPDPPCFIE